MTQFAVVDLETTGFGKTDKILELAIVLVDGKEIVQQWETLINPQRDISNSHIHGLTADVVSLAPTFDEVVDHVSALLHGRIMVAHNLPFDSRMLVAEFKRLKRPIEVGEGFCTLRATREKLAKACARYGIHNEASHRALTDARATAELLLKVYAEGATVSPMIIEGFWPQRSPRVLSRAALHPSHALPQSPFRPLVREVGLGTWSGPLLSYMETLCCFLADMRLSAEERAHLNEYAMDLGISAEDQNRAHTSFLDSVVQAARRDLFISDSERELLERVSAELGVKQPSPLVPQGPSDVIKVNAGMRVCFTGQSRNAAGEELSREWLQEHATSAGLIPVDSVSKKACDLLVAADASSMSGKAKKARSYGIPVLSTEDFLALIKN